MGVAIGIFNRDMLHSAEVMALSAAAEGIYDQWGRDHATNNISIKLKLWSKLAVLWLKMCSIDHNEILYKSRQCYCHDVPKILLWSAEYVMNKSIAKLHWIFNSIKMSLVGLGPGLAS